MFVYQIEVLRECALDASSTVEVEARVTTDAFLSCGVIDAVVGAVLASE